MLNIASGRLTALFLSLAMVLLVGCGASSSPESVVENLYEAIEDNRSNQAASYFSATHLGETNQTTQLQQHLKNVLTQSSEQIQAQGGLDSVNITNSKEDDPVAMVEAEVKLNSGKTYRVTFSLTEEDDKWKIILNNNNLNNLDLS